MPQASHPRARIIVLGGTGNVGSAVVHELLQQARGVDVVCVVRDVDAGKAAALRQAGAQLVSCGDLRDAAAVREAGFVTAAAEGSPVMGVVSCLRSFTPGEVQTMQVNVLAELVRVRGDAAAHLPPCFFAPSDFVPNIFEHAAQPCVAGFPLLQEKLAFKTNLDAAAASGVYGIHTVCGQLMDTDDLQWLFFTRPTSGAVRLQYYGEKAASTTVALSHVTDVARVLAGVAAAHAMSTSASLRGADEDVVAVDRKAQVLEIYSDVLSVAAWGRCVQTVGCVEVERLGGLGDLAAAAAAASGAERVRLQILHCVFDPAMQVRPQSAHRTPFAVWLAGREQRSFRDTLGGVGSDTTAAVLEAARLYMVNGDCSAAAENGHVALRAAVDPTVLRRSGKLWTLGITSCLLADAVCGSGIFKLNPSSNPADVEEPLWQWLCDAVASGAEYATRRAPKACPPDPRHYLHRFHDVITGADPATTVYEPAEGQADGDAARFYVNFYNAAVLQARGAARAVWLPLLDAACASGCCDNVANMAKTWLCRHMREGQTLFAPAGSLDDTLPRVICAGAVLQDAKGLKTWVRQHGPVAFDVADIYPGAEAAVGRFRAAAGDRRSKAVTKFVPDAAMLPTLGIESVRRALARSARRMGDVPFVCLFHVWDRQYAVRTAKLMAQAQEEGLCRHVGATNLDAEAVQAVLGAGVQLHCVEVQMSLLDRRPQAHLVPLCASNGIHIVTYGVLAGGWLSASWLGQRQPDTAPKPSMQKYLELIKRVGWDAYQTLLGVIASVAEEAQCSFASVCVAWALRRGCASAIVGMGSAARLPEAFDCVALADRLTDEQLARLDAAPALHSGAACAVYTLERGELSAPLVPFHTAHSTSFTTPDAPVADDVAALLTQVRLIGDAARAASPDDLLHAYTAACRALCGAEDSAVARTFENLPSLPDAMLTAAVRVVREACAEAVPLGDVREAVVSLCCVLWAVVGVGGDADALAARFEPVHDVLASAAGAAGAAERHADPAAVVLGPSVLVEELHGLIAAASRLATWGAQLPDTITDVCIVGGGLGGLSLAAFLGAKGIPCTVLDDKDDGAEAAATAEGTRVHLNGIETTAGYFLQACYLANGIDLEAACLERIGTEVQEYRLYNKDGTNTEAKRITEVGDIFGMRSYDVARPTLHKELKRLLAEQRAAPEMWGSARVVRIFQAAGADGRAGAGSLVKVFLSDGRAVAARLLAGCDGVKSTVRSVVLDQEQPEDGGATVLYGLIRDRALLCGEHPNAFHLVLDDAFSLLTSSYKEPAETWWALLCPQWPSEHTQGSASSSADPASMWGRTACSAESARRALTVLGAGTQTMAFVDATETWPYCGRLLIRPHDDKAPWHSGRVVLLGDAVHAQQPWGGYGGQMAVEDAYVLAELIEQAYALQNPAALSCIGAEFRRKRVERVAAMQAKALRMQRKCRGIGEPEELAKVQNDRVEELTRCPAFPKHFLRWDCDPSRTAAAPKTRPLVRRRRAQGIGIEHRFELEAERSSELPEYLQAPRPGVPYVCIPKVKAGAAGELDVLAGGRVTFREWGQSARGLIDSAMAGGAHPVVLLHGLPIKTAEDFSEFCRGMDYPAVAKHGVSERKSYGKNVFGASDDVPKEFCLAPHNEQAYLGPESDALTPTYPRKLFFCCTTVAEEGGETAVTLNKDVHDGLRADVREKFERLGCKYRQVLIDEPRDAPMVQNLGGRQSWQKLFDTESKEEAERLMSGQKMTWRWFDDGRLEIVSPLRPVLGPRGLWFNQVHNPYSFDPLYGDGTPVSDEVMEHINAVLWQHTIGFQWSPGDVLCFDNELALHCRMSFEGKRKIMASFSAV